MPWGGGSGHRAQRPQCRRAGPSVFHTEAQALGQLRQVSSRLHPPHPPPAALAWVRGCLSLLAHHSPEVAGLGLWGGGGSSCTRVSGSSPLQGQPKLGHLRPASAQGVPRFRGSLLFRAHSRAPQPLGQPGPCRPAGRASRPPSAVAESIPRAPGVRAPRGAGGRAPGAAAAAAARWP